MSGSYRLSEDGSDWVVIDEPTDPAMFAERREIRWVAPIAFVSARDISWIYDTSPPRGDSDHESPEFAKPLAPLAEWLKDDHGIRGGGP